MQHVMTKCVHMFVLCKYGIPGECNSFTESVVSIKAFTERQNTLIINDCFLRLWAIEAENST